MGGEVFGLGAYVDMPRRPRVEIAGGVFHVWARGNDRARIFFDDVDREIYLELLAYVVRKRSWYVLAYCLMDNHVHLVVETPEANLALGMQSLQGLYAQDLNDRRGRTGHVFEGRYGARLLTTDEALCGAIAYVVRNPVAAGLCESPGEWPWSSHVAALDGRAPEWLAVERLFGRLEEFGGDPIERYVELTAA